MDFVTGLPRSPKGHEAIWVIVDKMTKTTHFIPVKMNYSLDQLAQIYIEEIMSLHAVPASIVSDPNPRFTSKFWESLHKALGINLSFSTTFHQQTDGLSGRTIRKDYSYFGEYVKGLCIGFQRKLGKILVFSGIFL